MSPQCERVLKELRSGLRLTQFESIQKLGILRLASRIDELRQSGHKIKTEMIQVENRYGEKCHVANYILE